MSAPERAGDAGFTLVEAMIAGTMALLIALPAYSLLGRTYRFADVMQSRFRQSEAARQILTSLGDGSALFGTTLNARGFPMVEGLRSRAAAPTGSSLRQTNRMVLADTNGLQIASDTVPGLAVPCVAAGSPIPDCKGAETQVVGGWLGSDPAVVSASGQSVAVGIAVIDPYRAQRAGKTGGSATETFRSIFTLNVEADP